MCNTCQVTSMPIIFVVQFKMDIPGDDRFDCLFMFLHKYPTSASNKGLNRHLSTFLYMRKQNRLIAKPWSIAVPEVTKKF